MAIYKCMGRERHDLETDTPVCSYESPRVWYGRCPQCGGVYEPRRFGVARIAKQPKTTATEVEDVEHLPTGVEGVDKLTGGGLVAGCVYLFGGEEGAGKTTLAMMVADGMAKTRPVVYASAEQSDDEVIRIAKRVGVENERVRVLGNVPNVHSIIEFCQEMRPVLAIFDSIQMMTSSEGPVGSSVQGEQVANIIRGYCKKTGMIAIAINQLSRSGYFKGSTMIGHMVDMLMYLDKMFPVMDEPIDKKDEKLKGLSGYDNPRGLRELIGGKNRNAAENARAYLEMTAQGQFRTIRRKSHLELV